MTLNFKNYIQFNKLNPFGSQAKLLFHIDKLYQYLFQRDCYPIMMEINLTNKCNLSCSWCINSNFRGTETLDFDALAKFLKESKELGLKAITFSGGGDPTLYQRFIDAVKLASYLGFDIGLMTNGCYNSNKQHIMNEVIGNHVKWIRFSVDTIDNNLYKKWKGVDLLNIALTNIETLNDYPVKLGVNCNVCEEHTIEDIKKFIKYFENKVDYIQFRPVLPRYFKVEKTILNKEVWKYLKTVKNPKINISNDKLSDIENNNFFDFTVCDGHFFEPILNANGDICTCMYHPNDDRFVFGNIYNNSFKEIWNSQKRKDVINFVRALNYQKECQADCKCTEINKFLDYVNHPNQAGDINHI